MADHLLSPTSTAQPETMLMVIVEMQNWIGSSIMELFTENTTCEWLQYLSKLNMNSSLYTLKIKFLHCFFIFS